MRRLILLLGLCLPWVSGYAHKPSDSYLTFDTTQRPLSAQWDIALRDLEFAIGLDADNDGSITWGELQSRSSAISAYALSHLRVDADGVTCTPQVKDQLVDYHSDGAYAVLRFSLHCPVHPSRLDIRYTLLLDLDAQHRGITQVRHAAGSKSLIFGYTQRERSVDLADDSLADQILDYGREGVWHIWIGFDHVLFLLALLIPSVFLRQHRMWHPAPSFRAAFLDVCKLVSAFTLAHSITLSLAALGVISLPASLVETAIAVSVVFAALANLTGFCPRYRWLLAFGFGLIHGFGFANVLADLGLPSSTLAVALLAFNLGVELGQLAIVGAFLPLAYSLRDNRLYQFISLKGASAMIALLAVVWVLERSVGMEILGA